MKSVKAKLHKIKLIQTKLIQTKLSKKAIALILTCAVLPANTAALHTTAQTRPKAYVSAKSDKEKKQAPKKTARQQAQGIHVAYHSIEEIRDYVKKNKASLDEKPEFEIIPAESKPYNEGKLSDKTEQSALNMLKQIRYIAGVSDEVQLSEELIGYAQAGAYVNYVNGKLTHFPEKPEGMSDEVFQLGEEGARRSNIAWQSYKGRSLNEILALSWMKDGDGNNIGRVGHRRWLINPAMGQTGFGVAGSYSFVYAHDISNASAQETGVAWPAQNMPTEYFNSEFPWSVSMGHIVDKSKIKVSLTRMSDKKTWNFSSGSSDGIFNVDNDGYGAPGCIIFRPASGIAGYKDGDSYQVTITGDREEISYTVNFFNLITLESISATYTGDAVIEGGEVEKSSFEVKGSYSDGTVKEIQDFTVKQYEIKPGENEITIQYKDKKTTVKVPGKARQVTIKFDPAGGQSVSDCKLDKGTALKELPTTSRDRYIFEGWYTKPDGGVKLEESAIQEKDATYYAHWKKVELSGISAEFLWGKRIIGVYGLEKEAFEVIADYTDGKSYKVSDFTIDDYTLKDGENTLTIRYEGKSTEVKVPAVSVKDFSVMYIGGQKMEGETELDDLDIRVYAKLSDGETVIFKYYDEAYTIDPFVIQPGNNTLTLRIAGQQATFQVICYSR